MAQMRHSSSLSNKYSSKFLTSSEKAAAASNASASGDFNFGENINQWKKYLEIDEFVSS
jgi:hypothetical protein